MTEAVQVIGLGELLWDCFPDRRRPGGATANVAFHVMQLGLSAAVASRVGKDELGTELCDFLTAQGLSTHLVQIDSSHKTGTVTISPVSDKNVDYVFLENSSWDFLAPLPPLMDAVASAKAICFGTLAQRRPTARHTIHSCLHHAQKDCLIVYDLNLRPPFFENEWIEKSLELTNVFKLNDDEVKILSHLLNGQQTEERVFAQQLLDRYKQLELVCITRGERGCLAVSRMESSELPGNPVNVVDPVGAGDAFTAAVIFGRLEKWPLQQTIDLANRFGALVASRPGAMPPLKSTLAELKFDLEWAYRATPPSQN